MEWQRLNEWISIIDGEGAEVNTEGADSTVPLTFQHSEIRRTLEFTRIVELWYSQPLIRESNRLHCKYISTGSNVLSGGFMAAYLLTARWSSITGSGFPMNCETLSLNYSTFISLPDYDNKIVTIVSWEWIIFSSGLHVRTVKHKTCQKQKIKMIRVGRPPGNLDRNIIDVIIHWWRAVATTTAWKHLVIITCQQVRKYPLR